MDYELELPEEFEGMELLQTLISPAKSDTGIMILGENYAEGVERPTVRIYLISIGKDEWNIEGELQAFTFPSFGSAKRFVEDLPSMSAIDLLCL
ncbi:geranylgeranyl pyrophosphate synthase (plasmid) [Planococcus glaciei]|nr:geranylgeranyl pyrophosphate synthase [Planococcus glaciei]QDY46924.1 geranylgeranyl pyrophosphate synthase [Planococcus glaciei]